MPGRASSRAVVQSCDLARCFPSGLVLLCALAGCHGVHEGGAVSDAHGRDGQPVGFESALGLGSERAARRDCAEHRGGRGAGELGDVLRSGDSSKVEHRWSAGHQHQVSGAGGCKGSSFGVRGRVDDGERYAVLAGRGKHVGEPCGLGGHHHGGLSLA